MKSDLHLHESLSLKSANFVIKSHVWVKQYDTEPNANFDFASSHWLLYELLC